LGEVVQIRRRLETGGVEFVVVLQPDGSFACLPAWMTEPAASRFTIDDEPHFPLHILRSMRAEVDALLFVISQTNFLARLRSRRPFATSSRLRPQLEDKRRPCGADPAGSAAHKISWVANFGGPRMIAC
jgi:hypothetical protein